MGETLQVTTNISEGMRELMSLISEESKDYEGVPVLQTTRKGLSTLIGKSVRTVSRYLSQAEEAGLVSLRSIKGNRGGIIVALNEKGQVATPVTHTDSFDRATVTTATVEDKVTQLNDAIKASYAKRSKSGRERATKLEMVARRQREMNISLENERKNELLKNRPITQSLTWEFFKDNFGEEAVQVCGAYRVSRLYDAYFEASTNAYSNHDKNFPYSYSGTYFSLPNRGDWFGTSNYSQFEAIFLEMQGNEEDIDFLKVWGNAFYVKFRTAVSNAERSTSVIQKPRYAPYPKNLHLGTMVDIAEDSLVRLGTAIKRRQNKSMGYADTPWKSRLPLDKLAMYDFYDPTCKMAGLAFKEFLAVARQERGNTVKFFDVAYTQELPTLVNEAYDYMNAPHIYGIDNITEELSKAYFDNALNAYFSLEDREDKDFSAMVSDPANLAKLESYLKDTLAVQNYGIASSIFTVSSPHMYHPLVKLRRAVGYLDEQVGKTQGALNEKDQELMDSTVRAIQNLVPNHLNKGDFSQEQEWLNHLKEQSEQILRMVHPAGALNFEHLTESGTTLRQLAGIETHLPSELRPILDEISDSLFLDEFGLVDWDQALGKLILDNEEYMCLENTPRYNYENYFQK